MLFFVEANAFIVLSLRLKRKLLLLALPISFFVHLAQKGKNNKSLLFAHCLFAVLIFSVMIYCCEKLTQKNKHERKRTFLAICAYRWLCIIFSSLVFFHSSSFSLFIIFVCFFALRPIEYILIAHSCFVFRSSLYELKHKKCSLI